MGHGFQALFQLFGILLHANFDDVMGFQASRLKLKKIIVTEFAKVP